MRADTLPVEERVGLTGRTTTFQHMLVFRRALAVAQAEAAPQPAPAVAAPARNADLAAMFADPAPADQDIAPGTIAAIRANKDDTAPATVRLVTLPPTGEAPPVGAARGNGHAAE